MLLNRRCGTPWHCSGFCDLLLGAKALLLERPVPSQLFAVTVKAKHHVMFPIVVPLLY